MELVDVQAQWEKHEAGTEQMADTGKVGREVFTVSGSGPFPANMTDWRMERAE